MRYAGYCSRIAIAALCAVAAIDAAAQDSLQGGALSPTTGVDHTSFGFESGSFIVVPIPLNNPTIGAGLVLGAGYLFSFDPVSDPSGIAVGAMKTDNGSQGYGVAGHVNFGNGKWQVRARWGRAELVYDFYDQGTPVELAQKGDLGVLGASYYVTDDFSIGLDLGYTESELSAPLAVMPPSLAPDIGVATLTADLIFGYDTRDDVIYPTSGMNASLRVGRGVASNQMGLGNIDFGSNRTFTRSLFTFDFYKPIFDRKVLAGRISVCDVSSQTPYFLACMFGYSDSFRGYPSTQFIGDSMASAQVEYRGRFGSSRFGYAGFAGVGAVGASFSQLHNSSMLAAGGVGLRYRVSRKFPVDFSADVALNINGDVTSYLYVGQRF